MTHHLVKKIRKLAEKYPDHVDPNSNPNGRGTCQYFENGKGSCGVGHAFEQSGKTPEAVPSVPIEGLPAAAAARELGFQVSDQDQDWLSDFQNQQDRGKTWAEAVAYANEHYPEV
jgi:hypothetical protein